MVDCEACSRDTRITWCLGATRVGVCVGGVRRRIRVLSQEVCVFRDALVDRLAKNTINSVSTEDPYACVSVLSVCKCRW